MNVNAKYLKDENGDIISPIVSIDTIFKNNITLLDLFYPVGTYYETSNSNFNPNESWGGTWVEDTKGYVTIGATTSFNVVDGNYQDIGPGTKIGEYQHTLTTNEMPAHSHPVSSTAEPHSHTFSGTASSHTHTFTGTAVSHNHTFTGTASSHTHNMSLKASGDEAQGYALTREGAIGFTNRAMVNADLGKGNNTTSTSITPKGSISNTNVTAKGTNSSTSITPRGTISTGHISIQSASAPVGGNQAFNITQPSIGVFRWHRTA